MTIWWCEEHEAQQTTIEPRPEKVLGLCWKKVMQPEYLTLDCRMVEMHLVPVERLPTADEVFGILTDPDENNPSTR